MEITRYTHCNGAYPSQLVTKSVNSSHKMTNEIKVTTPSKTNWTTDVPSATVTTKRILVDSSRQIEVRYSSHHGLQAFEHQLNPEGKVVDSIGPLPILKLPSQIKQLRNLTALRKYFDLVHLIPNKDKDRNTITFTVRVSGLGGTHGKIPYQQDMELGSVIRGDIIEKLEEYVSNVKQLDAWQRQLESAQRQVDILTIQQTLHKPKQNEEPSIQYRVFEMQIEAQKKVIKKVSEKLGQCSFDVPEFEGFQLGIESPIDFENSKIVTTPRGFDSLDFSSSYINMSDSFSEINKKNSLLSTANSASGTLGWKSLGATLSGDVNAAVSSRLASIKQTNKADGVLVIKANMTTRNVRSFQPIRYDTEKLRSIWNAMQSGSQKELNRHGISVDADGKKSILILTEAVLGGTFTGLVTFLKQSDFEEEDSKDSKEIGIGASLEGGAKTGLLDAALGFATSNQISSLVEKAKMREITNTKIEVEIFSQGAIPSFSTESIKMEVAKFLKTDPAMFHLTGVDEEIVENSDKASIGELEKMVKKRRLQMSNAQCVIQNTVRELVNHQQQHSVHSIDSVTEAFNDFNKQVSNDIDCGFPLSFNYRRLTEAEIRERLGIKNDVQNSDNITLEVE